MGRILFRGGTVVTAEGSYEADVLVDGEKIVTVGSNLPAGEDAETIDVSGKLLMPGFIDGHTHMDMPFGGTVTADDWATGTAAALAGGTTTIVDFSLQDPESTLADAVNTWHGKANGKSLIDYGFHVAITNLREVKDEIPRLADLGVSSIKIFMAYKGTPLYAEDADLFEAMQIARDSGILVMVHAENGDVVATLQEQALAAGNTSPVYHALTRPEEAEAEATNRAIQLAEIAGAPLLIVHVSCAAALEPIHRAHELGQTVYAETCPQYFVFSVDDLRKPDFEGAKYVCSPPMRESWNREPLWRGLQLGDLQIFGSDHCSFNFEGQKELGKDDFTKIPNGCPGAEERAMVLWTLGVLEGRVSENEFVKVLATNQAKVHGMYPRKGTLSPGSDADIVVWNPMLETTATVANRHGNVDYTPYEGMRFHGGPSSVYVRGNLAYRDGNILAEHGSGKYIERNFMQPAI